MNKIKNYINGNLTSESSSFLSVENPSTGDNISEVVLWIENLKVWSISLDNNTLVMPPNIKNENEPMASPMGRNTKPARIPNLFRIMLVRKNCIIRVQPLSNI